MKRLTRKEEEIMNLFWKNGSMFIRELLEHYQEPKPHFNTLSTMVRTLESNGYISHETFGNSYRYFAAVTREEYSRNTLSGVIKNYFDNSYIKVVSTLIREEKISAEELKELISEIEKKES